MQQTQFGPDLCTLLAFRFDDPVDGIKMCKEVAKEIATIPGIFQRIIKPTVEIEWGHGPAPFKDPTIFWVITHMDYETCRSVAAAMEKVKNLASGVWYQNWVGNMVWGACLTPHIAKASINIYYCKDNEGEAALKHRINACNITQSIHAGPPYLFSNYDKTKFIGVYESKDEEEMLKNRKLQYGDQALMEEIDKISPHLSLFGRIRGADVIYYSNDFLGAYETK